MKNNKGFTLIELLAVITIMGILMLVAIPTVSRTIENARKDTFIDLTKQYVAAVRTMWAADSFQCGDYSSSTVPLGIYYVAINTMDDSTPVLLEQGGKSPWGKRDVMGLIVVAVREINGSRFISYHPIITDGIHGINIGPDDETGKIVIVDNPVPITRITRGSILMSGAEYTLVATKNGEKYTINPIRRGVDLNGDDDVEDEFDGVLEGKDAEGNFPETKKCVER